MIYFISLVFLISLNTVLSSSVTNTSTCNPTDDFFAAQLILFFAPMERSSAIRRQIIVYYYHPKFHYGDEIRIYATNSSVWSMNVIDTFRPIGMKGTWKTGIVPVNLSYNVSATYTASCLGYAASWSRMNTTYKFDCLSTHPDWMNQSRGLLKNQRIPDIFIPGTHNSGSYSEDDPQSLVQQLTVTQDHDVFQQLMSGARYIDLRPSFYNGLYYVNHGPLYRMNSMEDIIDDIKQFMNNTNEIVIVSFKEFPSGFGSYERHQNFMAYLEQAFAEYLLPRSLELWEITLEQIWNSGRRLILSYDYVYLISTNIWPKIEQEWPNAQNAEDLKKFFLRPRFFFRPMASMAELTMDHWSVFQNIANQLKQIDDTSLRRFGAEVGPLITEWFNELFYSKANIVAVDYIDATGIVNVAIDWNYRRFSICSSYYKNLMTTT